MRLIEIMKELGALKIQPENPFTWTSGYKMPVYNDNRALLASAEARSIICERFKKLLADTKVDAVIGTATAGIPHATTLADSLGLPLGYVRSKPKEHGTANMIEGFKENGSTVVLVEDLVSTGKSSLAAARALEQNGLNVCSCLAIFSYGFKETAQLFSEEKLTLKTLLTLDEVMMNLSARDQEILTDWQKDPFNWNSRN